MVELWIAGWFQRNASFFKIVMAQNDCQNLCFIVVENNEVRNIMGDRPIHHSVQYTMGDNNLCAQNIRK